MSPCDRLGNVFYAGGRGRGGCAAAADRGENRKKVMGVHMSEYDCGYGAWIPGPVLDDPGLRPRSLILYSKIARRANRVGFCYATNATLIEDMTAVDEDGSMRVLSERTIQAMLAELQERGHIRTDCGPLPADKSGTVRTGRRIYIGRSLTVIPDAPQGGEENFTPEKNFTQGVKKSSPPIKGIKERKKNNNPHTPKTPGFVWDLIHSFVPADDTEYFEALEGLLVNREALKKPILTTQAMNKILNRLRKVNDRATEIAMLNKAVELNWLTVYPLKADELPGRFDSNRPEGYSREAGDTDGI